MIASPAPSSPAAPVDTLALGDKRARGVTPRVVFLCLGLAVLAGYVIPIVDVKMSNTFMGAQHLPPSAVGVLLFLLLVINPLLRMLSKRLTFSRNEILTVYISCLFSTLVPGHGGETLFISQMVAPFYYATRENRWIELWQTHLKPWMTPSLYADGGSYGPLGQRATQGWFNGLEPGQSIPWGAWLVPLLSWSALIFAMYGALACLSVMLRAQWGEHEALSFPLLRLPLEMTEDVDRSDARGAIGSFFRNPLMWLGFGLAVFIQSVNGLSLYFPDVPRIPLGLDTGPLFSEAPWNQISGPIGTPILIWPMVIGITFLLTAEVSFSFWFFYWFMKFQLIAAYYLGFMPSIMPTGLQAWGTAFVSFERVGGFLAYALLVLWVGRRHFGHIAQRGLGRAKATPDEASEALSYPVAFWGFIVSSLFVVIWGVFAGIRPDITLAVWAMILLMLIALSRLVVEGGILLMTPNWMPLGVLGQIFNSGPLTWLSPQNGLIPANFFSTALVGDPRAFLLPSFLQGFKLAHDRKIAARPLLALVSATIAIAFAMSCWMRIRLGYENGAMTLASWFFVKHGSQLPAWFSNDLMNGVSTTDWHNGIWLIVGALFTYLLVVARSRLPWFPFHPIGFLLPLTWAMDQIWFSIFLGWGCKVTITRFGGIDSYRKITPAFLGLALGDICMTLFWIAIDGWQGRVGHHLTPD